MLATLLAAALWASPLTADTTPRWAQVSVGGDHACALDDAGRAYCWGNNHDGQLGAVTRTRCGIVGESGHRGCYNVASDTPVAAGGGMRFASILAGRYRTCAVDGEGRAFCWGAYVQGSDSACATGEHCSFTPQPYEPGHRFRSLSGGSRVVCGVTVQDEALCTNLLNGDRWWELQPMRPERPGTRARAVAAMSQWPLHNVCLVDADGAAWCRGSNRTGQLGAGSATSAPVASSDEVDSLTRVAGGVAFGALAMEYGWICGLDTAGRAYCWGQRSRREFWQPGSNPPGGCGRIACAREPVAVGGPLRFRSIGAHRERVCGLTAAGEAYCWGPAPGDPHAEASADYEPAREQPDLRFSALAGNVELGMGSCGITLARDAIYCWDGANERAARYRVPGPRR